MSATPSSRAAENALGKRAGWFGLLFLVVFAVFSRVLSGELLRWDDDINISGNPHLSGPVAEQLRWIFTDTNYMRRYQPLVWLTWAVIKLCFGLNPFWFHFVVLLFHALNAGLVFLVIRKLLLLWNRTAEENATATVSICAALAAAWWALHPMRVETTAWAVELLFVQPVFFFLLSVLCYLGWYDAAPRSARRCYWASLALFIVSLLSYPLALGGCVVYLALDIFPLRRLGLNLREWGSPAAKKVLGEKVPFVSVAILAGAFNLYVRGNAAIEGHSSIHWARAVSLKEFPLDARVMQAFYIWAQNVWKPWAPFHLTPLPTQLVDFKPFDPPFVMSALLVVGLTALLIIKRQKWPGLFVLWMCHLALLVPVLGLSEHPHYPADRYSLLVSIDWAVLLGACFAKVWPSAMGRRILSVALVMVFSWLCIATYQQTARWHTNVVFFRSLLGELSDEPRWAIERATLYRRLGYADREKGDYQNAVEDFRVAMRLSPGAETQNALGDTFLIAGELDAADATYTEVEKNDRTLVTARDDLGVAYAQKNKLDDAVAQFGKALSREPQNRNALQNMAEALRLQGKTNEAAAYQEKLNVLRSIPPPKP